MYKLCCRNNNNVSSSESVQMCGQGEVFLANDEEITKINKLLTDSGFSPLSTNLMRLHNKAIISGKKYSSRKNKRVKKQNSYTIKTSLDSPQYGLINFFCLQMTTFWHA